MKKQHLILFILILAVGMVFQTGCGKRGPSVERTAVDTVTDLSGDWNDTDSRQVSTGMIKDCLNFGWIRRFKQDHGGERPIVIVGFVANRGTEQINTETFIQDLERAFLQSGDVRIVANNEFRMKLRSERVAMQDWTDPTTAASIGQELGANFMLFGQINMILDEAGGTRVKYYKINLELVDMTTNEKVWVKAEEIKKIISREDTSW